MKLVISALAILAFATYANASGIPLTQAQAESRLIPAGILARSSGGCTDKSISTCCSYQGILSGTVAGIINLKRSSGVPALVITGGTEVGHRNGAYSHTNGYKVDVRPSPQMDKYITSTFNQIEDRSDGYHQWQAPNGDIYCVSGSGTTLL